MLAAIFPKPAMGLGLRGHSVVGTCLSRVYGLSVSYVLPRQLGHTRVNLLKLVVQRREIAVTLCHLPWPASADPRPAGIEFALYAVYL